MFNPHIIPLTSIFGFSAERKPLKSSIYWIIIILFMFTDSSSFVAVSPAVIPKPRDCTDCEDVFSKWFVESSKYNCAPSHIYLCKSLHFNQLINLPCSPAIRIYYKIQMACFLIQRPQGLFRNYSDAFLPVLKPHMERLANDSHESTQRCVAEIIAGLVRGSKHWSFSKVSTAAGMRDTLQIRKLLRCLTTLMSEPPLSFTQVEALWKFLIPLMRTALSNITVETYADWGTCVATACVCVIDPYSVKL